MEGLVPCPSLNGTPTVQAHMHPRLWRLCNRRTITATSHRLKTIEADSFINFGPKLFNCLPRQIRDTTNCITEVFKKKLNGFLQMLPDEPPIPHNPQTRGAASNSVLDQLKYKDRAGMSESGGLPSWP